MKKRFIETCLQEISFEQGLRCEVISDGWVVIITDQTRGKATIVIGYNFELNSSVSEKLANDKIATYLLLQRNNIPAAEHIHVASPRMRDTLGYEESLSEFFRVKRDFPLVLKPIAGTGGNDVLKIENQFELESKATALFNRFQALALCPFYKVNNEYRVVMLEGEVLLVYKKVLEKNSWKHNLQQGARPVVIKNKKLVNHLSHLAEKAMAAIGLRLAAVDIIEVDGSYMVLEINSGIMGEVFSTISSLHREIYKTIYAKILAVILK